MTYESGKFNPVSITEDVAKVAPGQLRSAEPIARPLKNITKWISEVFDDTKETNNVKPTAVTMTNYADAAEDTNLDNRTPGINSTDTLLVAVGKLWTAATKSLTTTERLKDKAVTEPKMAKGSNIARARVVCAAISPATITGKGGSAYNEIWQGTVAERYANAGVSGLIIAQINVSYPSTGSATPMIIRLGGTIDNAETLTKTVRFCDAGDTITVMFPFSSASALPIIKLQASGPAGGSYNASVTGGMVTIIETL